MNYSNSNNYSFTKDTLFSDLPQGIRQKILELRKFSEAIIEKSIFPPINNFDDVFIPSTDLIQDKFIQIVENCDYISSNSNTEKSNTEKINTDNSNTYSSNSNSNSNTYSSNSNSNTYSSNSNIARPIQDIGEQFNDSIKEHNKLVEAYKLNINNTNVVGEMDLTVKLIEDKYTEISKSFKD